MKSSKLSGLVIGLLFLTCQIWGQASFPMYDFLDEKVRDTTIRNFMIKQYEGKATAEDIAAMEEYLEAAKQRSTDSLQNKSESLFGDGAEPHIVIHPTNPNILALAYMSGQGFPVFISTDAGASWTQSSFDSEAALDQVFPGDYIFGWGDPIRHLMKMARFI
jgi:hypothetical protein